MFLEFFLHLEPIAAWKIKMETMVSTTSWCTWLFFTSHLIPLYFFFHSFLFLTNTSHSIPPYFHQIYEYYINMALSIEDNSWTDILHFLQGPLSYMGQLGFYYSLFLIPFLCFSDLCPILSLSLFLNLLFLESLPVLSSSHHYITLLPISQHFIFLPHTGRALWKWNSHIQ